MKAVETIEKTINNKKTIWCRIRKKDVKLTKEETVRQEYIDKLIDEYDYPEDCISVEVTVVIGREPNSEKDKTTFADIVVYPDKSSKRKNENVHIIIETKYNDQKGEKQVKSYGNVTKASVIVWFDGITTKYWKSGKKPKDWEPKFYLPKHGQKYGDKKILKTQLKPATRLKTNFKKFHNDLRVGAKSEDETKIFDQVMYLLFAKIEDELSKKKECEFVIYDDEDEEIQKTGESDSFKHRIVNLFDMLKNRQAYKNVFDGSEKIDIPTKQLAGFVAGIEYLTLLKTDSKGEAYQTFVSNYFRKVKGQFFTPDPVKELMVKLIDPQNDEVTLDPACGTSGFLIYVIKYIKDRIKHEKGWLDENGNPINDMDLESDQRDLIISQIKNIATTHLRGVEKEPNLSKVGKIWMMMMDDGHTGIYNEDSLIPFDELEKSTNKEIKKECAKIILTNPPFGSKSKVTSPNILEHYDLGHKWIKDEKTKVFTKSEKELKEGQVPDILFIERCIDLLQKGGRMAIVLPDGDLNNLTTDYVRAYLKDRIQYVGIISLPRHTFLPFGANEKTSIILLIKPKDKVKPRYPIFFYNMEKIGYDGQGKIEYRKNDDGEVLDCKGKVISYQLYKGGINKGKKNKQDPDMIEKNGCLDTEFDDILEKWNEFKEKHSSYLW